VTALGGYVIFALLRRLLPRARSGVVVASGIAGFVSVVLASIAFTLEYAIGGTGGASVATVFGAMVGVHVLIGIGEGLITAATVAVVLAVRPDVVYGASDLEQELEIREALVPSAGAGR
jgi:cobalt/nickel transport system permease protein